jgi:hypothetical protein
MSAHVPEVDGLPGRPVVGNTTQIYQRPLFGAFFIPANNPTKEHHMSNPFDQHDASPDIVETKDGSIVESSRSIRVGPDLHAALSGNASENDEHSGIALQDVVDGDRERIEMMSRDAYDDDFDRINNEMALCDERMASTIDPETGRPYPHLQGDYARYESRKAGLQFSLENQTELANLGRQSRLENFEANVAEDERRLSAMKRQLQGITIRHNGKDIA